MMLGSVGTLHGIEAVGSVLPDVEFGTCDRLP
jgi:hypothetical protein